MQPGYGWLAPAVGTVEMMQCVVQAVSIEEKKKQTGPGKSAEGVAALLQLPHFDAERVRKLQKRKIKSLPELQRLDKAERRVAMQSCGLAGTEVDDVEVALSAMPTIYLSAKLSLDESEAEAGEAGVAVLAEEDVLVCAAHVMLLRPSHQAAGFDPDTVKGTAARVSLPPWPLFLFHYVTFPIKLVFLHFMCTFHTRSNG